MAFTKVKISDLKIGTNLKGYMFLQKIEEVKTPKTTYCVLQLADGFSQPIKAKMWKMTKENLNVKEKTVIGIDIKAEDYEGSPSFIVNACGTPNNCDLTYLDFIDKAPLSTEQMYQEILDILAATVSRTVENTLAGLAAEIYKENKKKLLYWSAAESIHHNMYGGLLYHTYRMLQQAKVLICVYPSLDAEVLLAATALHDIGKLEELSTDEYGIAEYTIDGQLFGHAVIGMQMVDAVAARGNYNMEKVKCLKHCIAAHHGKLEWGAIQLPRIEEAAVLHYIDMIDSRIQQYEKSTAEVEPGTTTEAKVWGLDNVKIYKPEFKTDTKQV